ncbi:AtpZ/AtpI family protein [Lichenifustis flavocetrariae]|uniref:ATP synthase protein I n=1 Tax=Lichenifustis flavocetrariae TaxID=2949735 RepID=A0AA41YRD9_9HYPH|nr:AtpZ/AtpI family protein [Lichenifustis flavocetrariae]MCW6507146.1 AtpZ/AtpI family protein [Lichenifustis flavocetrariae]
MTDPNDMHDRLAKLSQDLEARTASAPKADQGLAGPNGIGSAMSTGFRVMSEFVAAVAVGGLIGWQCDRWFGTSPFLLILFLALGTAAGFWTVYRIASKPTRWVGPR